MRTTDRLRVDRQRATATDAILGLKRLVTIDNGDEAFALALEEACIHGGIDFAFAYAHAANESNLFRDPDYTQDNNAFGIGHPDNAAGGIVFRTKREGARFYVAELLWKMRVMPPMSLADAPDYAPEKWDSVAAIVGGALGPFPTVERIADLNKRFGPNNREAVWMTDPNGPQAIVDKARAIFGDDLPDQEDTTPMPSGRYQRDELYVLVDAGHRDTTYSGNAAEMARTDEMAEAYVAAFRARGWSSDQVRWWQRDEDGDDLPRDTRGNLNTVCLGMANNVARRLATNSRLKLAVVLSTHFNGGSSPWHVIVTDNRGLTTAVNGGAPDDDIAANNALDVELARVIAAKQVAALGGYSLFSGKLGIPGIMSETETGVALQYGARLAFMAWLASQRAQVVRLIVEHGGTGHALAQNRPWFEQTCADAVVDAVESVLLAAIVPGPGPGPEPPIEPKPVKGKAVKPPDPYLFRVVNGRTLVPFGGPSGAPARFAIGTTTREAPDPNALPITTIKRRTRTRVAYTGVGADGEPWMWLTSGSWVKAKSFVGEEPVGVRAQRAFATATDLEGNIAVDETPVSATGTGEAEGATCGHSGVEEG